MVPVFRGRRRKSWFRHYTVIVGTEQSGLVGAKISAMVSFQICGRCGSGQEHLRTRHGNPHWALDRTSLYLQWLLRKHVDKSINERIFLILLLGSFYGGRL